MHGNVFALAVIAMIGAALAVLKVFGKRPDRRALFAGILLAVVTFFVLGYLAFGHLCFRGGPFGVVVFGAVFAGALRATVERKVVRRRLWIGWCVLTFWGTFLCHLDDYIGNPAFRPFDEVKYAQTVLRDIPESRKSLRLPEGWIEESWRTSTGEDFPVPTRCRSSEVGRYWHTWFTGVFSLETHDCGIWCPGGSVKSCSECLVKKPRAPSNGPKVVHPHPSPLPKEEGA